MKRLKRLKRFRFPKSFTLNGLIIFVALFCVSTFAFLEHTSISIGRFSAVKLPLMYLGFACIFTQIKTISRCLFKKSKFYTLLTLALFCVLLIISMFANRDSQFSNSPLRYTLRFLLYLVELFLLMIIIAETGRVKTTLNFLFWYLLLITAVNDVLMFTQVIRFVMGSHESYLVGTKFSVSYLHMNLLTMWVMRRTYIGGGRNVGRWQIIVAAVFIILVAGRVDCVTGVLGCLMLAMLFVLLRDPRRGRKLKLLSPWMLLAVMIASVIFAFVADAITQIPLVEYVMENILHRDPSITGRTNIYEMYVSNLQGHWLTGYGYGNGNDASMTLFGYENVQNGILQWVLQIGVPATIGMVAMMMQVFRLANRSLPEKRARMMPLVALIYMYIVLGTIETTFNMAFFMWFALVFMLANEKLKRPAPVMELAAEEGA